MADRLAIPDPDVLALATGETVVAFVPRNSVDLNDELELEPVGRRSPGELAETHAHLATSGTETVNATALVVGLQPAASLAGGDGAAHHILASVPDGDIAILRVYTDRGPVLTDDEFEARREAIEAMFR